MDNQRIIVNLLRLLLLLLTSVPLYGQQQPTATATAIADSTSPQLTKNPTTAVLLSLPLPGLGQWYNEQYWKIPIFTGTCGVTAFLFFKNNADYNATADLVDQAIAEGQSPAVIESLKSQRETFRDNRDLAGFVFVTAYLLAAVDAYVGAHLYDFDVSDDVSMNLGPTRSHLMALNLSLSW